MSTNSYIAFEAENGNIDYVYCHSDGHLGYNGRILQDYYLDAEKVKRLVKHGDMSFLEEDIDYCVFYSRDRGEPFSNNAPQTVTSREELIEETGNYYTYVFSETMGSWTVRKPGSQLWVGLRRAIDIDKKTEIFR